MVYVSINKDDLVQGASNNKGEKIANGTGKTVLSDALNEKIKKRKVRVL